MAVTITSSFASEEQIKADMVGSGLTPDGDRKPVVPAQPVEPPQPSAPSEKPGESPVAAPSGESAPASEAGEKIAQGETPAGEGKGEPPQPAQPGSDARPPRRDNFKSKIEKLEARESRLLDDLELERGGKAKLQKELEELRAELAKLRPAEPETAQEAGPVRPKRPTLAECDFDQTKLDEALDKYDQDMDGYHAAMEDRRAAEREAKREQERQQELRERAQAEADRAFLQKKDEGVKAIPGWDDTFEELERVTGGVEVEVGPTLTAAIRESADPAALLHYFFEDTIKSGAQDETGGFRGEELRRILSLSPIKQAWAIREIEQDLKLKRGSPAPGKGPQPVPARETPAPTPTPARPRPAARVEEPIEPVGSRASANGPTLSQATSLKDYIRLRNTQGVNR